MSQLVINYLAAKRDIFNRGELDAPWPHPMPNAQLRETINVLNLTVATLEAQFDLEGYERYGECIGGARNIIALIDVVLNAVKTSLNHLRGMHSVIPHSFVLSGNPMLELAERVRPIELTSKEGPYWLTPDNVNTLGSEMAYRLMYSVVAKCMRTFIDRAEFAGRVNLFRNDGLANCNLLIKAAERISSYPQYINLSNLVVSQQVYNRFFAAAEVPNIDQCFLSGLAMFGSMKVWRSNVLDFDTMVWIPREASPLVLDLTLPITVQVQPNAARTIAFNTRYGYHETQFGNGDAGPFPTFEYKIANMHA